MAHNTHIPWNLLASQFKFVPISRKNNGEINLRPQNQPNQGSELTHFARIFAQTISSFSVSERSKYTNPMPVPEPDDVVISEQTAKKIGKTITHYRATNTRLRKHGCQSPLSLPERQMAIWIDELDCRKECRNCCCYNSNHSETWELARTLLLYGEVESLLRIVAHPNVSLVDRWDVPWACGGGWGIAELMRCVLMSYLFLNVVYLHPEIWEAEIKRNWIAERKKSNVTIDENDVDYRKMISWEKMVSKCTGMRGYDVHAFPHRLFFGFSEHAYNANCWRQPGCGRKYRAHPSLQSEGERPTEYKYLPVYDDVEIVLFYLRCKEIPTEIGLQILAYADFKPERRLPVANDPFDPRNKEELRKYLSWCWKVLVWCNVVMTASGGWISWVYETTNVITELWGRDVKGRKIYRHPTRDEAEADYEEERKTGLHPLSLEDRTKFCI